MFSSFVLTSWLISKDASVESRVHLALLITAFAVIFFIGYSIHEHFQKKSRNKRG